MLSVADKNVSQRKKFSPQISKQRFLTFQRNCGKELRFCLKWKIDYFQLVPDSRIKATRRRRTMPRTSSGHKVEECREESRQGVTRSICAAKCVWSRKRRGITRAKSLWCAGIHLILTSTITATRSDCTLLRSRRFQRHPGIQVSVFLGFGEN
jgi:hypothetical protein